MQLDELAKSAKDMTDEELRDRILKIRASRRNYSRVDKKKAIKKVKEEEKVDWDEIAGLIDGID